MDSLTLQPIRQVGGVVRIPGSKSLSNRILLLAALAEGTTTITNLLDSDDIRYNIAALKALGVDIALTDDNRTAQVKGLGKAFENPEPITLFLGNAGTAMRPLTAALALSSGSYTLTGEPRMEERPIGDLVDALQQCGADIRYLKNAGYPPIVIQGTGLRGGRVDILGNISSQFLTALLMASPLAQGDTQIRVKGTLVSKPYIDITLDTMAKFGVEVVNDQYQRFDVQGRQTYRSPGTLMVEGDASSASYFLAAAAISGGHVRVEGVGKDSIQGDIQFADVLAQMGASVRYTDTAIEITGPKKLKALDVDLNHIPDAAMTIAVAALFAEGTTRIRNIYNWRVKETDRLSAMATELRKVGAEVEEGEDFITIMPPERIQEARIDTYNDHRMAMCFSLAALGGSPIHINDPGCVAKTFPDYFDRFASICTHQ